MDNSELEKLLLENLIQTRVNAKALQYLINRTCLKYGQEVNDLVERFKKETEIELNEENSIDIKK